MLNFAAVHDISPVMEKFEVNEKGFREVSMNNEFKRGKIR
jgi:hypothetical protein